MLFSDVDIIVNTSFEPFACNNTTGTALGFGGPRYVLKDFPNAPLADITYPAALANSIAGVDIFSDINDINTFFNSAIDLGSASCIFGEGWDYRLGVNTGSFVEFYNVALHELAHGLGFLTLVDQTTGALFLGENFVYSLNLLDRTLGLNWSQMSDSQRFQSATNTGNLVWSGAAVAAEAGSLTSGNTPDGVQMYAPGPVATASNVSHWDISLSPNQVMSPFTLADPETQLSKSLLFDIGWLPNNSSGILCNGLIVTVDLNAGDIPTAGNDVILGTNGPDTITSLGGNDTICGLDGDDTINAGRGNDWVDAGPGDDSVFGLDGADTLAGGDGNDEIVGGNGDDLITGALGNDTLNGGPGDDSINGGAGDDNIFGQAGNDFIEAGIGADFVTGSAGTDEIFGGPGSDVLNGGPGDDLVRGNAGSDSVFGFTGNDTVDGGIGNDRVFGQVGADTVIGGAGDDQLFGNEGPDTISDISGTNIINGGFGDDVITGGSGDDTIFGDGNLQQAGNDDIDGGEGVDLIIGFAGSDTLTSTDNSIDTVNGGPGVDTCNSDADDIVFLCP